MDCCRARTLPTRSRQPSGTVFSSPLPSTNSSIIGAQQLPLWCINIKGKREALSLHHGNKDFSIPQCYVISFLLNAPLFLLIRLPIINHQLDSLMTFSYSKFNSMNNITKGLATLQTSAVFHFFLIGSGRFGWL